VTRDICIQVCDFQTVAHRFSLDFVQPPPASADDIKKLDLYGDLISMPKNTEADPDQEGDVSIPAEAEKHASKKTLGRLKNKKAVLDKVQAMASASTAGADDEMREPDVKKTKSERGDESRQDVVMAGE